MSSTGSDDLRAVFIEIEPTRETSTSLRPFHHARVVVTDPGQHEHSEPLNDQSTGTVYDRGDGVMIGTTRKNKTLDVMEPQPYSGMPEDWKSTYCGYTDKSPEEIKSISDNLVQGQIDSGIQYNIPYNNCLNFAQSLADEIGSESVIYHPDSSSSSDSVWMRRAKYGTIAGGNADEAGSPTTSTEWSETLDEGFSAYREELQPDWYHRPSSSRSSVTPDEMDTGTILDSPSQDDGEESWRYESSF